MPLVLPRIDKRDFDLRQQDSETNYFAGSKKNVAQKTGLTKDSAWNLLK